MSTTGHLLGVYKFGCNKVPFSIRSQCATPHVVSFLFVGGDKPTFKTTPGWCVAHRKGFAWKECRELTPRERNIDFAEGVAMATAKTITKLLVICRQCDLNLPQRPGAYHS